MAKAKRILIATIGSLGDLHPCLALALESQRRGHHVTIACTTYYQPKIEALGIDFLPMRPNWDPTDSELIRRCEDIRKGIEVLFRDIVLPELHVMYEDLLSAIRATSADLVIAGEMVFAAPLAAEKLNLRWVSALLSPASFLSAHDPSVLANVPELIHLRKAGWPVYRAALNFGRLLTRHWWRPVRLLRAELGLRTDCDPLFRDKFSPDLVLALFSRSLAEPQPDWPAQTIQPGFVVYDQASAPNDRAGELAAFLASGEPPIVFTLGSTAVHNAGDFFDVSLQAVQRLGRRAIFLHGRNELPAMDSKNILALPYAPFSTLFPHAAVIVHQGGSGTTGQAMRAGKPMLIVPYGWDQPDNGARIGRLGIGLCLTRRQYAADRVAAAVEALLTDSSFSRQSARVGEQIKNEDALTIACDAIESLLSA